MRRMRLGAWLAFFMLLGCGPSAWAHQGHTSAAPWAACAQAELGQVCSWENEAHDGFHGTCRAVGEALVCVRNRPIEHADTRADAHHARPSAAGHAKGRTPLAAWPLVVGASAAGVLLLGLALRNVLRGRTET